MQIVLLRQRHKGIELQYETRIATDQIAIV